MLPRKYKLKRKKDFDKVFKQGKYFQKDFIKMRFLKNELEISRFAFMVGLKVSKKATERNKTKRYLEESIQLILPQIIPGFDIAVLVKPEIVGKKYQEINKTLVDLLKESRLIA